MTQTADTVWEQRQPGKFLEHCYLKRPDEDRSREYQIC